MASLYCKYKQLPKRKQQTLHAMCVGFVCFILLYLLTAVFPVSLCPIKRFFGVSCFGCGLSSGFVAILQLDLRGAYNHHILSLPLFLGIILYYIGGLIDIFAGTDLIEKAEGFLGKKYMYVVYAIVFITIVILHAQR